jgi:MAC/Perforin domain
VLADEYLGVTYNPVCGAFGRTRILDLGPSQVKIIKHSGSQSEEFVLVKDTKQDIKSTATQLHVEFEMRDVAGLSSHYSSSHAFKSALSNESQLYHSQHVISVAKINALCPRLSMEMIARINRLPPLPAASLSGPGSPESKQLMQQYHDFFASHGTHVVLRVALGGVLRVVSQANSNSEERTDGRAFGADARLAPNPAGVNAALSFKNSRDKESKRSSDNLNVMIFRDGGGAVASQLTRVLEQQFARLRNPSSSPALSDWTDIRVQWIDELENDPVFCPDNPITEYQWLYNLDGLTAKQKEDLRQASHSYLIARPDQKNPALDKAKIQSESAKDLPRQENRHSAFKIFKTAWAKLTNVDHGKSKELA